MLPPNQRFTLAAVTHQDLEWVSPGGMIEWVRNPGRHSMIRRCSVLFVLAAACYPVQTREEIKPTRLGRDQQVKIWSGDTLSRWHAVVITADSITGVPYKMSTKCDTCRLRLPLDAVDSIRLRYRQSPREQKHIIALMLVYGLVGWERR
jgi:hypothetical protein